ncbi:MAG: hypothetical protein K9L26_03560 [Candidatus Izimaplasma sp.]|nr:hypothetical protein [Candidatus Izimaplasma bacterium]
MRKVLIIIGVFVLSLGLYGCQEEGSTLTAPTFVGFTVDNQPPVEDGTLKTFYKEKQEQTLIKVEMTNPDNVLIKSIVVNGYKYHSTRFTDASTATLKVFPMNAGSTLGETEYTIDEITYMDGDTEKAVRNFDDNAFIIYVYKGEPSIVRENYTVSQNMISVDFNIQDTDQVIIDNTLKAKLFSGDTLIEEQDLSTGLVTVTFDELLSNKQYELKVQSSYNLDNNQGTQSNIVMFTGTFETVGKGLPSATIANVNVNDTSVIFDVNFVDEDEVLIDSGLRVGVFNEDGTLFKDVGLSGSTEGITIDELLNDTSYSIKVLADYDLKDGSGVLTDKVLATTAFVTLPQAVPQPSLTNMLVAENTISFNVALDDPNDLIFENTLEANLYFEGVYVDTVDLEQYSVGFDVVNVFANTEFTIEIIGDYDLNDGKGVIADQIIYTETFSTLEKAAPSISVLDTEVTQGYVTLNFEVDDPNETLTSAMKAYLYQGNTLVKTIQFNATETSIIFDYPTVFTEEYYIEIEADYNLSDGSGRKTDQLLYRGVIVTGEKKAPIAEFSDASSDTSSIDMTVTIIDADNTIVDNTLFLDVYLEGTLLESITLINGGNTLTIDTLLSNNAYEFEVRVNYDLNDSSGVLTDQILSTTLYNTLAKTKPSGQFGETVDRTTTAITFDAFVSDPDAVIIDNSIMVELLLDGVVVDTVTLTTLDTYDETFATLLSNIKYGLKLYADYDLNDGNGVIANVLLAEISPTTVAKQPPSATIEYLDINFDDPNNVFNIEFGTKVTDLDSVSTGGLEARLLLYDDVVANVVATQPLSVGNNSGLTFGDIDLLTNQRYFIQIVADYDLNDTLTIVSEQEILYQSFITSELDAPEAFIENVIATNSSITFDVTVYDDEDVITNNLEAVLYQDDTLIDSLPLVVGSNTNKQFTNLDSSSTYELIIETDYNLNDDEAERFDIMLDAEDVDTETNAIPTASITNITPSQETLDFEVLITDDDSVSSNLQVGIYDESDTLVGSLQSLTVGTNTLSYTSLLSDHTYTIKVTGDYDLDDGVTVETNASLATDTGITLAKQTPSITITNTVITENSVTFDFAYDDIDSVLTNTTLKAALVVDGTVQAQKNITTDHIYFDISGMLADYEFVIQITGDYNLDDGAGIVTAGTLHEETLSTLAYTIPTADITAIDVTQQGIVVDVTINDSDNVITNNLLIKLYDNTETEIGSEVLTSDTNTVTFATVANYGEAYSVVVLADYNLLDGEGAHAAVTLAEGLFTVQNKLKPEVLVENEVVTHDSITFDVTIFDDDLVINGTTEAILYKNGVVDSTFTIATLSETVSFTGLLSGVNYTVIIETDYDNGDGNGTYTDYAMATETYTTDTYTVPSATVTVDGATETTISTTIVVTDVDGITTALNAKIYDGVTLIDTQLLSVGTNSVTFSPPYTNTEYRIVVEATYDLNEGVGVETNDLVETTSTTLTYDIPTAAITVDELLVNQIDMTIELTDLDGVITGNRIVEIYYDGTLVDSSVLVTGTNTVSFTGLYAETTYDIEVSVDYNLSDNTGLQAGEVITTTSQTTPSLDIITIENETIDKVSNTLDVVVDDPNEMITGDKLTATLYQGTTTVDTYIISKTTPTTVDMLNLLSGFDYRLEISGDYMTGAGSVTSVIYTHEFTTLEMLIPTVTIESPTTWTSTPDLTLDVTIGTDDDNVANDTEWNALLYQDGVLVSTVDIDAAAGVNPEGLTTTITFTGYDHTDGSSYTVVVQALADLNDVANQGEVITDFGSRTFIDAGN